MLVGAGGNIAVQIGDDGVLVVDTGLAQNADRVIAAIKKLSNKPIRWVLNTHFHPDHTGGNEAVAKAGSKTNGGPAEILAHENVLTRMSAPANKIPTASWPTDTYFPEEKDIYFNGEAVMLFHDVAAHTDGDSIVLPAQVRCRGRRRRVRHDVVSVHRSGERREHPGRIERAQPHPRHRRAGARAGRAAPT